MAVWTVSKIVMVFNHKYRGQLRCGRNKHGRFPFLNLDVDLYEPSKVILEYLWPLMSPGGIMLLDDYAKFPGETKAADDYFGGMEIEIKPWPGIISPWFVEKP